MPGEWVVLLSGVAPTSICPAESPPSCCCGPILTVTFRIRYSFRTDADRLIIFTTEDCIAGKSEPHRPVCCAEESARYGLCQYGYARPGSNVRWASACSSFLRRVRSPTRRRQANEQALPATASQRLICMLSAGWNNIQLFGLRVQRLLPPLART